MDDSTEFEFHVSRQARDRYQFDGSLFSLTGNVLFANLHAARMFARKMNERRAIDRFPEQAVQAGQIYAMGLLDETLHFVVGLYRRQKNPLAMRWALDWCYEQVGAEAVDQSLGRFLDEFPPLAVYRHEIDAFRYFVGETDGVPHREILLEELLMLWLANENPAFAPFYELFDDSLLDRETAYHHIVTCLADFFSTQSPFGPNSQNLVEMLRSPAVAAPDSLAGQITYIQKHWADLLGSHLYRLLSTLNLLDLAPGRFSIPFERMSFSLLHKILAAIEWHLTPSQVRHYREMVDVIEASGCLAPAERRALLALVDELAGDGEPEYSWDFPQDYIGIGGDLV
jgi:hypothetical protein